MCYQIVKAEEIIKKINNGEDIRYENVTIEGDLDFTKVENKDEERKFFYRIHINSIIIFINCKFIGKVIAYKVIDENTFYSTEFKKSVSFKGSTFKKGVVLNLVKFRNKVKLP